jgi:hypothetical protein
MPNADAFYAATSPNSAYLYAVGRGAGNQLYRFSPVTHLELSTTSGVANARGIAFTADSARAYVAAQSSVYVIDTSSHAIVSTIPFFSPTDGTARSVAVLGANPLSPTPSNFRVTSKAGVRVSFAWNEPAGGPPLEYVLRGGLTPGSVMGSAPTGSPATTATLDLPTGIFFLRVHARTASGLSPASNEIQVCAGVVCPPLPPTDMLGLANGSDLTLSWRNNDDGGPPTSLVLEVSGAISASTEIGVSEMFTFSGVPGGTYSFRLQAKNSAGTSAKTAPVTLTFPDACAGPPQLPRNVVVQRDVRRLSVAWDPPSSGPAVTGYVLTVTGPVTLAVPLPDRRIAGDVPPGTYNFSVAAVNPCGSSAQTVPQSIVVP